MSTSLRSLLKTLQKTSIYSANIAGSRGFPIIKFLHYCTTLIITYWQIPLDEWLVVSALLYQVYCFFDRVVTSKRKPPSWLFYIFIEPPQEPTFHSLDICSFCNGLIINWLHTIILGQIMYVQVNC